MSSSEELIDSVKPRDYFYIEQINITINLPGSRSNMSQEKIEVHTHGAGAFVNIDSTIGRITQHIQTQSSQKMDNSKLLEQISLLQQELKSAKDPDSIMMAEVITQRLDELVKEAAKPTPSRIFFDFTKKGLLDAAETLCSVLPAIMPIVTTIAGLIILA